MSRHTRATTVVSHPPRFSTPLVPTRLSRSQDSCTASSASLTEPSIRYATARRWVRFSSNRSASQSRSSIDHIPLDAIRHGNDVPNRTDVTRRPRPATGHRDVYTLGQSDGGSGTARRRRG
jgi:hypothetical protein